jgi:hypothetical protein
MENTGEDPIISKERIDCKNRIETMEAALLELNH